MANKKKIINYYRKEASDLADIAHKLYLDYVSTGQSEYLKKHNEYKEKSQLLIRCAKNYLISYRGYL